MRPEKLLITSYKVLIRSLVNYVLFIIQIEILFKELNLNETESFVNLEKKRKKKNQNLLKFIPILIIWK